MTKPVCVKCQRFFKPDKNGVFVLEQKPAMNGAKPGLEEAHNWIPYKVWQADRYKCDGCGTEIVIGFGYHPLWQDFYSAAHPEPHHTVNDC